MRSVALLMVVLAISACKKEDGHDCLSTAEPNPCGEIAGIDHRDVSGAQMFPTDTTDWRPFDAWCPAVEALFSDLAPVTYSEEGPDSLRIIGFPNPTQQQLFLGFARDDSARVDLRIVDTGHQLLWSYDSLMVNAVILDLQAIGLSSGQIYRVYYRVAHTDGTAHRGHGDVEIVL